MKPIDEASLTESLTLLERVGSADDICAAADLLVRGLGVSRYVWLDQTWTVGVMRPAVYHNAPAHVAQRLDVDGVEALLQPILGLAQSTRIPTPWGPDDTVGTPLEDMGDCGYRHGLVASSSDGTGSTVSLIVGTERELTDDGLCTLMAYMSLAAAGCLAAFAAVRRNAEGARLSERELECLGYAMAGWSAKQTARATGLSPRTVTQYLERSRAKLGARTSFEAATIAARRGWLSVQRAIELADSARTGTRQA